MNREQEYIFDLQGYLVLKNVVPPDMVAACNRAMDRIEDMDPSEYPSPLLKYQEDYEQVIDHSHAKKNAHDGHVTSPPESELYISNILEGDPSLQPLIDRSEVIDVVRHVTGSAFRLNHTYGIWRWGRGFTRLHHNGTPILARRQYRCHNGRMLSSLTKAVFPMLDAGPDDGCFAVIPGSHKANFPRPWPDHPDENPLLVPVPANAGDCIVFTEALAHGSTVNASDRPRRTLYYCYSTGWMPEWGGAPGLRFSDRLIDHLTEAQAHIVRLKEVDAPEDRERPALNTP